ncbi:diguanylate cyclase [bacterium]|nr:diguanylate cyclase [bacterium]
MAKKKMVHESRESGHNLHDIGPSGPVAEIEVSGIDTLEPQSVVDTCPSRGFHSLIKTLNHIAFVRDADFPGEGFTGKLESEGFSFVEAEPSDDLGAELDEARPAAVILAGLLGADRIQQMVYQVRERFAYVPILILYDEPGAEHPDRPLTRAADGVCYSSMPASDLGLLLRGVIRSGFTIQELVLSNRKLNEISITDALTGLYNRGYMIDRLNLEFKRASRNREALSVLMIDLDHFKQINDTYGHKFGDIVLEAVSQRLKSLIRETDIFGRYGGEEFLIVLPNTDRWGAAHLAEKLRGGLESEKISHDFFSLSVTASFGVASSENAEVVAADHLLQISDRALYRAKESGRNRVCIAGDERNDEADPDQGRENSEDDSLRATIDVVSWRESQGSHIQALLSVEGYETFIHITPDCFLQVFKDRTPDLLVLDCSCLPADRIGQSTQEAINLAQKVKRQTQDHFFPLVLLLPEKNEALRDEAMKAEVDDTLMGEVQGEEFLARLRSLLHVKSLHDRWRNTYRDLTLARSRLIKMERLTALGEMASGVAHDFNNILSAILGRAQILRRDVRDPEILRNLEVIERAANDGAATIRRIQEFSRSTADRAYETVDLAQIIKDCIQITRTRWKDQAEMAGVRYRFRLDLEEPLHVKGSPTELREVVTNLIMNGLDAMPKGGEMSFHGRVVDNMVMLDLSDTGHGMNDLVLKRIFDPFFSTKKGEGTGLGLSVAYGIMARHNGRIECSSTEGKGATFHIQLPFERDQAPLLTSPPVEIGPSSAPRNLRILVVDDETAIREIFRDVLEPDGHEIFLAESGEKALQIAENQQFDLVFTDLSMPGMSGWEVARQIKQIHPETVIVLTSGWGKDFNQQHMAQHGVSHILPKPVPVETLQNLTRQLADGLPIEF